MLPSDQTRPDQTRQTYFNAKGKRANAIKARTTPSLEETRSENMQQLDKVDQCRYKFYRRL